VQRGAGADEIQQALALLGGAELAQLLAQLQRQLLQRLLAGLLAGLGGLRLGQLQAARQLGGDDLDARQEGVPAGGELGVQVQGPAGDEGAAFLQGSAGEAGSNWRLQLAVHHLARVAAPPSHGSPGQGQCSMQASNVPASKPLMLGRSPAGR
jgi:hypothetical protein